MVKRPHHEVDGRLLDQPNSQVGENLQEVKGFIGPVSAAALGAMRSCVSIIHSCHMNYTTGIPKAALSM